MTLGASLTGAGNRPVRTPCHQQARFTGMRGGMGGEASGSPMICLSLRKPISGSCIAIPFRWTATAARGLKRVGHRRMVKIALVNYHWVVLSKPKEAILWSAHINAVHLNKKSPPNRVGDVQQINRKSRAFCPSFGNGVASQKRQVRLVTT